MRRRDALRGLAAAVPLGLVGCLSDLPRASGPRGSPEPPEPRPSAGSDPTVADIDVEPTDDDMLRVLAVVRNPRDERITPTIAATVTLDDEEYVRRSSVEVPANDDATATLDFDLTFDAFSDGGSVSARIE